MIIQPSYIELLLKGDFDHRVARALKALEHCNACPRHCGTNRHAGERQICRVGRHALVSCAFAHFGEEYCLSGVSGSGTIFFSSCNLRCVFCQNWDISQRAKGRELNASELADLMIGLQDRGCHNINFVTPEHVVPQVVEALAEAARRGLHIPIVYNTSGYDAPESLELLHGLVDIYMPDIKCWERDTAARLLGARDYPEVARNSMMEMHRQVGDLLTNERGIARKGLLVRHLVMPRQLNESRSIVRWIAEEISTDTCINIMDQYRPAFKVGTRRSSGKAAFSDINRPVHRKEVEAVVHYAMEAGLWRFDT